MSSLASVLAAAILLTVLLTAVSVVMQTIVAGVKGFDAPWRGLNPVARFVTVKSELIGVDGEYRRLIRKHCPE